MATQWLKSVVVSEFHEGQAGFSQPRVTKNQVDTLLQYSADSIQFAFSVFEGMRVFVNGDKFLVFRSHDHHQRLLQSCKVMGLASPSIEIFLRAIEIAVRQNAKDADQCLYIRPVVFATSGGIMAKERDGCTLTVLCANFESRKRDLALLVETDHPRTVPAFATIKTATNYANSSLRTQAAQATGYDSVLWLDQDRVIQECTTMNIFFWIDGNINTPSLGGILPGITRKTMIQLLAAEGHTVIERDVSLDEIVGCLDQRQPISIFTTSTALGVNTVTELCYMGKTYSLPDPAPPAVLNAAKTYQAITRSFANNLSRHPEIAGQSTIYDL